MVGYLLLISYALVVRFPLISYTLSCSFSTNVTYPSEHFTLMNDEIENNFFQMSPLDLVDSEL